MKVKLGKRDYIVDIEGSRIKSIYWIKDDKKVELELSLDEKEIDVQDLEEDPCSIFSYLLTPKRKEKSEEEKLALASMSEEEQLRQAFFEMDQKPCSFKTSEDTCFADGKECLSSYRKYVIFGWTCLKYNTDFKLMDKLYGRD